MNTAANPVTAEDRLSGLATRLRAVRAASLRLAAPLSPEDCAAQSMPDASPVKWHLAHTTWFFETFVLKPFVPGYRPFDPSFGRLYNSYYNAVGPQFARAERGLLTRPSLVAVRAWRDQADAALARLLEDPPPAALAPLELGLQHEQQHQELILTDVQHLLSRHPSAPRYAPRPEDGAPAGAEALGWASFEGGLVWIGHEGEGFSFDNEGPRHRVWLEPFELATRPASNAEYLAFVEADGYERPEFWLAAGFDRVRAAGWSAPAYWRRGAGGWRIFTLHGEEPLDLEAPVSCISYYEADAFARFMGVRLPSEAEWEAAAAGGVRLNARFADSGVLHPRAATQPADGSPGQMFGDVWEWTRSDYAPYPGFTADAGALGEYNAKFMTGQYVLRGGSCATPAGHVRASYRNFFAPDARWQISGVRLARDGVGRRSIRAPSPRRPRFIATASAPLEDERQALAAGLLAQPARIAPKHFYDEVGARLFSAITRLDAYALPRTEAAILDNHGPAIAAGARRLLGPSFQLVEPGAGDCEKAERLLTALAPARFVAIDIAAAHVMSALERLQGSFPDLPLVGAGMDFSRGFRLPPALADRPTLVFYPGSSLGNFSPDEARALLLDFRAAAPLSALLIGLDLVKDAETLERAYDDPAGVTAAFNRNVLDNVNRLLGADFDPARFRHVALYDRDAARIEMHLEAVSEQTVRWPGGARVFAAGERILTEHSRKWTRESALAMLGGAGFGSVDLWTDPKDSFLVALAAGRT